MAETPMKEMKQHEAAGKEEAEQTGPKTVAEKKEQLDALSQALQKIEAQTLSGVAVLTPKDMLLDISELQEKYPERHFRWVNIRAPGNADRRRTDGFLRLPESEGGREIGGELAIFVTTKKIHEARVARFKKMNKDRLSAHKEEMAVVAESVVRQMRDKYGIKLDLNRILVSEE